MGIFVTVLGAVLLASAFQARRLLFSDRPEAPRADRHAPQTAAERAGAAERNVLAVLDSLVSVVSAWDSTRTQGSLQVNAVLAEGTPLEEGNLRIHGALAGRGVQILDAVATVTETGGRHVELAFGVGAESMGVVRLASRPRARTGEARVAIVVSDLTRATPAERARLFDLDLPLSILVLPSESDVAGLTSRARDAGWEVILQVPMEPFGYPQNDPGPDAILVDMKPAEIHDLVDRHLRAVPTAHGLTSYMGSMATGDRNTMSAVFDVLERRSLFFLDVRESPRSIAPKIARERRLPCLEADRTVDSGETAEHLQKHLEELVAHARARHGAIGVFHADPTTIDVLVAALPRYGGAGVRFVRLSNLDAGRWIGAPPSGRGSSAPTSGR